MNTETVLLISAPQDFASRFNVESIGLTLCDQAGRQRGAGWAGWLKSGILKIRIHGVPLDEIRTLLNANFASASENAQMFSVVEQQTDETTLPDVAAGEIPWGTVIRQKLTKRLLDLLPEGAYVVSTTYDRERGEEIFSERLGPPETRETTWRRATLASANNRLCRLLWTEGDFNGLSLASHMPRDQK